MSITTTLSGFLDELFIDVYHPICAWTFSSSYPTLLLFPGQRGETVHFIHLPPAHVRMNCLQLLHGIGPLKAPLDDIMASSPRDRPNMPDKLAWEPIEYMPALQNCVVGPRCFAGHLDAQDGSAESVQTPPASDLQFKLDMGAPRSFEQEPA